VSSERGLGCPTSPTYSTGHGDEGGQLQNEGYTQKSAGGTGRYAGAPDRGKMAESNAADTDGQTGRLMEKILNKRNLYEAPVCQAHYKKIKATYFATFTIFNTLLT
jgi:hypothetical protein